MKKALLTLVLSASALFGVNAQAAPPVKHLSNSMLIFESMWVAGGAASITEKKAMVGYKKKDAGAAAGMCGEDWPLTDEEVMSNAYQQAVIDASYWYAEMMDADCKVKGPFDVSAVAQAYRVYTPPGMEAARDKLLVKQIAALACITVFQDGERRVEKLNF